MSGAEISLQMLDGLPAVINDPVATDLARQTAEEIAGPEKVLSQGRPSLGGEDFAFYQGKVPGCLVRFGARKETEEFRDTLAFGIRLILFITVPATVGLIILSFPIINTLWEVLCLFTVDFIPRTNSNGIIVVKNVYFSNCNLI